RSDVAAQDPAVLYIGGFALASVVPSVLLDWPGLDTQRSLFKAGFARFDAVDRENEAWDLTFEFQPGLAWHRIKPLVGMSRNSDGATYTWFAGALDLHVGEHLIANINSGPAFYFPGDSGKVLGSFGVLRSGFEVGVRIADVARTTLSFHHMSHGKLMNRNWNPGTETIGMSFWWTVG
ncbi:MAG: acyloxyacyl hydrolase, partial [Longimicrobiales bacterium]